MLTLRWAVRSLPEHPSMVIGIMRKFLITKLTLLAIVSSASLQGAECVDGAEPPYRLYKTENIYTFLELDTTYGIVWQLQWAFEGNKRFIFPINTLNLISKTDKIVPGRFILVPTTNMFNFVLLDQISGRAWQVQWSTEPNQQIIVPIQPIGALTKH